MKLDYQIVVDQQGTPQSALIDWAQFQQIIQLLQQMKGASVAAEIAPPAEPVTEAAPAPVAEPEVMKAERPADHVAGGDYKPLSDLGVRLPEAIQHKYESEDQPYMEKPAEPTVKYGRRIR